MTELKELRGKATYTGVSCKVGKTAEGFVYRLDPPCYPFVDPIEDYKTLNFKYVILAHAKAGDAQMVNPIEDSETELTLLLPSDEKGEIEPEAATAIWSLINGMWKAINLLGMVIEDPEEKQAMAICVEKEAMRRLGGHFPFIKKGTLEFSKMLNGIGYDEVS